MEWSPLIPQLMITPYFQLYRHLTLASSFAPPSFYNSHSSHQEQADGFVLKMQVIWPLSTAFFTTTLFWSESLSSLTWLQNNHLSGFPIQCLLSYSPFSTKQSNDPFKTVCILYWLPISTMAHRPNNFILLAFNSWGKKYCLYCSLKYSKYLKITDNILGTQYIFGLNEWILVIDSSFIFPLLECKVYMMEGSLLVLFNVV